MEVANPPPQLTESPQGDTILTGASWGEQLDIVAPLTDPNEHEASPRSHGGIVGIEPFILPPAAKPMTVGGSRSPNLTASMDLHDACRRAAAKLGIAWPEVLTETTTSCYEGKRLPKAKSSNRQLLPVFPKCLEEVTRSWSNPLSAKNPIQGGSALDWVDMEDKGFSHPPPVEPLLASHLHPMQKSTITSAGPTLPSKADCFQSSLIEKGYKAVAMSVKALNTLSLLLVYQAELEDDMSTSPTPALWDELCAVTDLCLHLHRCAVQASGRAMALMVVQERARWLNLSSLQLLDVPLDWKGLFGPAVATMQKCCEEKKRASEALQLCLPRKASPPPPTAPRQTFAQAVARPVYCIPKHQPQPQAGCWGQSRPPELKGAGARKPFAASVTPGDQAAPPVTLAAMKKRRTT